MTVVPECLINFKPSRLDPQISQTLGQSIRPLLFLLGPQPLLCSQLSPLGNKRPQIRRILTRGTPSRPVAI